mgnify:CR=1 FL=1
MLNSKELIIILDNIRSVHNVGAILRSSDGAGVKEVLLCGITPTPEHKKVHKTALNAEEYIKWQYFKDTTNAIKYAKELGYKTFAVEQGRNSKALNDIDFDNKTAFLFGNEITGVSPAIISECDGVIELPMAGKKNSLNVSTCAGIVIYYYKMKNE